MTSEHLPGNTDDAALANFDPATLREEVESAFARRMLLIYRGFNALAQEKYAKRGYQGLTPVHTSVMANLEVNGIRIVDLGERMGITKQFAGRIVQELLKLGFVTTEPDPTDRRAMLVKGTKTGWKFLIEACEIREEIEGVFAAALGPELTPFFAQAIEKLAVLGIDVSGSPEPLQFIEGQ